jgi:hypothetical protein
MLRIVESADQGDKIAGKPCPADFLYPLQKGECVFESIFFISKSGGGMGMTMRD